MEQISRIGKDTSKHLFQPHGVNVAKKEVLRKKLRRKEMVAFFKTLVPTIIGIEACGASHRWTQLLRSFGHEVKLIAAQLVKPYVRRGKNDAADADPKAESKARGRLRPVRRTVPSAPPAAGLEKDRHATASTSRARSARGGSGRGGGRRRWREGAGAGGPSRDHGSRRRPLTVSRRRRAIVRPEPQDRPGSSWREQFPGGGGGEEPGRD